MDLRENFSSSYIAVLIDFSRKSAKYVIIHIIVFDEVVNPRISNRNEAWDHYI